MREPVSVKWEWVGSGSAGMFVKVLTDLVSRKVCVQKFRKSPKYYDHKMAPLESSDVMLQAVESPMTVILATQEMTSKLLENI